MRLAFNDVAGHDVEWAIGRSYTLSILGHINLGSYQSWGDHYLTLGLSYLHQLVNTSSYEDRYRLLNPIEKSPNYSLIRAFMIESNSKVLAAQRRYSEEEVNMLFVANSTIDNGVGPAAA